MIEEATLQTEQPQTSARLSEWLDRANRIRKKSRENSGKRETSINRVQRLRLLILLVTTGLTSACSGLLNTDANGVDTQPIVPDSNTLTIDQDPVQWAELTTYRVAPGDSIWNIASVVYSQYYQSQLDKIDMNAAVALIKVKNNLHNRVIQPGEILSIPVYPHLQSDIEPEPLNPVALPTPTLAPNAANN